MNQKYNERAQHKLVMKFFQVSERLLCMTLSKNANTEIKLSVVRESLA